jgi:hypothetical protein
VTLVSVPAQHSCNRRQCKPNPRTFDPPALVRIREHGGAKLTMDVESACVDCGTIFAPSFLRERRYNADVDDLLEVLKGKQAARTVRRDVLDRTGSYKELKLPSWLADASDARALLPRAREVALQTQSEATRRGSIRHALGLSRDAVEIAVPTVLGNIFVRDNVVAHLVTKTDSGHNQLAHLTLQSLSCPREIWHDAEKVRFLALYRLGDQLATHMVVVHEAERWVYTAYEIDDSGGRPRGTIEERTNTKRRGTCRYVAYLKG